MTNDSTPFSAVPGTVAQPPTPNRYLQHDGTDASAAIKAGLEITGICIVGLAIILTLFYTSLRLLSAFFPPKAEGAAEADDD
jgi:hypothetical protein